MLSFQSVNSLRFFSSKCFLQQVSNKMAPNYFQSSNFYYKNKLLRGPSNEMVLKLQIPKLNFLDGFQRCLFPSFQYSHSIGYRLSSIFSELMENTATWLIKRTFQPSTIRKRRKTGFLKRHKSVGGRRVLNRRKQKGRIRLGGC